MEQHTITLKYQIDGPRWRWHAATGRIGGEARFEPLGLQPDDELLVELRWHRAAWRITRYVRIPEHAWMPAPPAADPPTVLVGGRPLSTAGQVSSVRPGDVRTALAAMNPRSTGERDVGRTGKIRPAVVAWVDTGLDQAGIHFLYDIDSAVRREGKGRRLTDWAGAGLHKPSVASAEQFVVGLDGLGGLIGRLTVADRDALRIGPAPRRLDV
jgi:hypothetical protein